MCAFNNRNASYARRPRGQHRNRNVASHGSYNRPAVTANPQALRMQIPTSPAPTTAAVSPATPASSPVLNAPMSAVDARRQALAKRMPGSGGVSAGGGVGVGVAGGAGGVSAVAAGAPGMVAGAGVAGGGIGRDEDNGESPHLHNEISRERFILTGGETGAPIMPSVQVRIGHGSKEKPRSKTAWEFVPFENSARSDGLKLSHWQRVGTPAEYSFARFNRPIRMVTYTDSEYALAIEPVLSRSAHGVRMRPAEPRNSTAQQSRQSTQHAHHAKQQKGPNSSSPDPLSSGNLQRPGSPSLSTGGAHTRRASAAAAAAAAAVPPLPSNGVSSAGDSGSSGTKAATGTFSTSVIGATGGSLRSGLDHVPTPKPWTKLETDELFRLCEQFDLRFPVVHDRWPDSFAERSIDELKDRYYTVAKTLLEYRTKNDPGHSANLPLGLHKHCQAIVMNPFDYEYECIRKNQLEWQYRRSKAELREEEETVREARRIEANRRRLAKERQRLAKLLTPAGEFGAGKGVDAALAAAASSATPQKTFPHRKVSTGPFARSSLVFAPVSQSSKVCKRVDAGLEELGVTVRPMPTCTVVDNFDLLRIDILNILELNRTVAKKEEEVYSLRVKLAKAKGEPAPPPPPGVPSSHKKRRLDDAEAGPIFGGRV